MEYCGTDDVDNDCLNTSENEENDDVSENLIEKFCDKRAYLES